VALALRALCTCPPFAGSAAASRVAAVLAARALRTCPPFAGSAAACRAAVVLAAALAFASCGGDDNAPAPAASTLHATLVDRDGDGALEPGPGEALIDRTELAPAAPHDEVIATVAQLTDTQVRDEESPARVPFLDRLGGVFSSTFRPHEALSPQVLAASVRAVNRLEPDAVFVTGDIVDSNAATELDQALAVLDGGQTDPDTGAPGYDGVQSADDPDPPAGSRAAQLASLRLFGTEGGVPNWPRDPAYIPTGAACRSTSA
jgi:hypothetical protein